MPIATTDDAVELYYESTGSGQAIVFIHEFAGDYRSWEPQMRHFSQHYQCISYSARGYPPSSVPATHSAYSQARAVKDVIAVMDHAGIERAHLVGLSMGGYAVLHTGLAHADRVLSLCIAGAGYGAEPGRRDLFRQEAEHSAAYALEHGSEAFAWRYTAGPTRLPFKRADPQGFEAFRARMSGLSKVGLANTQLGVQRERPSLYDMTEALRGLRVPTLVVNGDEDWPCLAPGLMLKATIPSCALAVLPHCGHTINLEMPDAFNRLLGNLLTQTQDGTWPQRDPAAMADTITGMAVLTQGKAP